MSKNKTPVRYTGQHFTIDNALIQDQVQIAKIRKDDVVLDIGGGKGYITNYLIEKSHSIIVIENDKSLIRFLRKKFEDIPSVKIVYKDFRNYILPKTTFKTVSNIPYGITSNILKKLMFDNVENFAGGVLIIQLEPLKKLFAPKVFNPYIIFYHTFFKLEYLYEVSPKSFSPPPRVKSALLKIEQRRSPNICVSLHKKYLNFLFFVLRYPNLSVRTALKKIFRKRQVRQISTQYGVNLDYWVGNITPEQWSICFREMLKKVPEKYHPQKTTIIP